MGLRHERAPQSNEVHMTMCVITHTYTSDTIRWRDDDTFYNTADYVSIATSGKHNCTCAQTVAEDAVESETVHNMPTGCIQ